VPSKADAAESRGPFRARKRRDNNFDEKREAVMQAAAKLFRERGYDAASLNDLADMLRITKPTLYYYVASKENLLLEILKRAQDEIIGFLKEADASDRTGIEKLRTVMIQYAMVMISDHGACLARLPWRMFSRDNHREVLDRITEADRILYRIIRLGEKDGTLAVPDRVVAYHAIFGSLNWMAYWTRDDGRIPAEELAEIQVDMLLNGIRGKNRRRSSRPR
jgi:AcrR family transcriptional regulator